MMGGDEMGAKIKSGKKQSLEKISLLAAFLNLVKMIIELITLLAK